MSGNDKFNGPRGLGGPSGTRRLVAPELLPALELLPAFDFNAEVLRALRAGAKTRLRAHSRTRTPTIEAGQIAAVAPVPVCA
jgi:hypothetical protein